MKNKLIQLNPSMQDPTGQVKYARVILVTEKFQPSELDEVVSVTQEASDLLRSIGARVPGDV